MMILRARPLASYGRLSSRSLQVDVMSKLRSPRLGTIWRLSSSGSRSSPNERNIDVSEKRNNLRAVSPKKENIYTIPNMITMCRITSTPLIGYLILHQQHVPAASLLFIAGLSDLVDGYIARKYNMGSVVGSVLDPFADKFLMTTLVVCLAGGGQMPVWIATIILGRDIGLGISALYWRYISLPPPKTFLRFWDMSIPSAEVRPTLLSKINTGLQLALVGTYTVNPILPFEVGAYLDAYSYLVASTTIWSGLSYIWSENAVKVIK